jgi:serine/threonine protein kinase
MGVPYDPSLDIWSIGCTLYELYTGKILFPGRSNNQMLLLMMELKGRFNGKMIKKAKFGDIYFDDMGGFESVEKDRLTGAVSTRHLFSLSIHHLMILCEGCRKESSHIEAYAGPTSAVDAAGLGQTQGR